MEIVIDIDEKAYKICKQIKGDSDGGFLHFHLINAVGNGVPLPKNHGRLIDADVVADGFEDNYEFCEVVNATPTIIEAEGE